VGGGNQKLTSTLDYELGITTVEPNQSWQSRCAPRVAHDRDLDARIASPGTCVMTFGFMDWDLCRWIDLSREEYDQAVSHMLLSQGKAELP
jgi:hypothetical protein